MTSEEILEVRGLTAGYGSMQVVHDFNIGVGKGEIVSLVGRNGAGKSTALAAVAGMRQGANSGQVLVAGEDVCKATPSAVVKAGLVHVPDGHRVFRQIQVEENLRIGAYTRRREGRRKVEDTLEEVYTLFPILKEYRRKPAGNLSGGEQQMVAIGQALMAKPRVLVLDEPTSGLALTVIQRIYEVLRTLSDSGLAIVIVEQNVERALANSSRCSVLEGGRIAMAGASITLSSDERVLDIVRGTAVVEEHDDPVGSRSPL